MKGNEEGREGGGRKEGEVGWGQRGKVGIGVGGGGRGRRCGRGWGESFERGREELEGGGVGGGRG